jgi:hypothetical protein
MYSQRVHAALRWKAEVQEDKYDMRDVLIANSIFLHTHTPPFAGQIPAMPFRECGAFPCSCGA